MWGPDGQLYAAENGYDDRGSRPIANALDNVHRIQAGGWYGFPDFSSGIPVTDRRFWSRRGGKPEMLMAEHPPHAPLWMARPAHAGVTKLDFSRNAGFGFPGQMFLAEVGSGEPIAGIVPEPAGHMVVRIDPASQAAAPFLWNPNPGPAGAKYVTTPGPRRPVEAKFSRDGTALYVVDVGVFAGALAGAGPYPMPVPGTGVIWRVTRDGTPAAGPANLSPMPPRARRR